MSVEFHIVIPARFHSTRFPGKLLKLIQGITVIERVYRQALKANPKTITIATDHQAIFDMARGFGANTVMTSTHHASGTDRLAEVVERGHFDEQDIIVNVQGDEPFIAPALIAQVAASLRKANSPVATLCRLVDTLESARNPNVVKVVRDSQGYALYFSRSLIPFCRDNPDSIREVYRHIGLYAYRAGFLRQVVSWPACQLETTEALEQLRILWNGYPIKVDEACVEPLQDINTPEDLAKACQCLEQGIYSQP